MNALPHRHLRVRHAVALCLGMVIGAGIFKTSTMVAGALSSGGAVMAAWVAGGVLSFVGALCFAEMAAAFPDPGGDYHFLRRAFGPRVGFLHAWSRFAIIHSGSMALLAFVFGDYAAQLLPAAWQASAAPAIAAAAVVVLTGLNLAGVRIGLGTQLGLMLLVVGGLLVVGLAAASLAWHGVPPASTSVAGASRVDHWSKAMVFVFLAYGGWSDAATLSAELRDPRRGIVVALVLGLSLITALYLLANAAYLRGLGLNGLALSVTPAADVARLAFGRPGEALVVAVVATAAVSVMNACLLSGARTTYAAVRDLALAPHDAMDAARPLARLAHWHAGRGTPTAALAAIGAMALLLVGLGTLTRDGFSTMVHYLSPVYWGFMLASGAALLVLRRREPSAPRPFRVPLYPLLPLAFCACSAWLLWGSLAYVKLGAVVGVAVLAAGAAGLAVLERTAASGPIRAR